ncbi:hypothetical protein [Halococcus sp. AFM35]|uniref:hypothetical protein n=1 Tax=Halococcus sp. AFM35 TaxID=3421653 RepID=UPI003EC0F039
MTGGMIPGVLSRLLGQYLPSILVLMIGTTLLFALLAVLIGGDRRQRIQRWVLLEANRWTITGIQVVAVFVIMFVLGITPLVHTAERTFSTTIFGGFTSGLLSLIPIVISVNQLTISQLLATPEKLRNKIESVQNFRTDIEEQLPGVSVAPTDPDEFLRDVNSLVAERATELRDAAADADEGDPKAEHIVDFAEKILAETDELADTVAETDLAMLEVLMPIMDDQHSENINTARQIREEHPEAISHRTRTVLEELEDLFVSMDIIRQYFKTLYIQEALSNLSKLIAYTGAASFVISMVAVMVFSGKKPLPVNPLVIQLSISVTAALAYVPIGILIAYIARIGTIVKHTIAPGAFTPRKEGAMFNK